MIDSGNGITTPETMRPPVNTTEWIKAHLERMDHSETRQVDRARAESAESLVVTGPETGL
ncbi:hypothetical protein ACFVKB_26960 [Rhodococcus sp. NPDC127530]|uniref:hypothetical protein n=1 Tax=unclassified Rhodococcus (in: high G+C Gram-positive bacteria) TaxID=192944 RepID=UPI00363C3798